MLVVLPFENLGGNPSQEFIADGMTEEMITQLGGLEPKQLGVIARTTSMHYKGTPKDTAQIARELGVKYLVEGSVRPSGDRIRVTAQLIQASDQTHLWAQEYDRDLGDLLSMEGEISTAIAAHIELVLSPQTLERIASARPVKPEAQIAYLSGLQAWNQRTREGFKRAIAEFQRAITLDPDYALAYTGLARSYVLAPIAGGLSSKEALPKAREAASHALMLDPNLSDAHAVMAMVAAHYDYDWNTAQKEFQRAIELNPSNAYAHFFYSNSYLSPHGRHDEAIGEIHKAIELDPLSVIFRSFLGRTYVWARRYDDAIAQFRQAEEMNPYLPLNHERLSHLYAYLKRYNEAIEEDAQARRLSGEDADSVSSKKQELQKALAEYGPRGYWETLLKFAQAPQNPAEAYRDSYAFAIVYAHLGNKDKALESLEHAYAERDFMLTEIGVEPALDPLRSEPAFQSIVARVGLGR